MKQLQLSQHALPLRLVVQVDATNGTTMMLGVEKVASVLKTFTFPKVGQVFEADFYNVTVLQMATDLSPANFPSAELLRLSRKDLILLVTLGHKKLTGRDLLKACKAEANVSLNYASFYMKMNHLHSLGLVDREETKDDCGPLLTFWLTEAGKQRILGSVPDNESLDLRLLWPWTFGLAIAVLLVLSALLWYAALGSWHAVTPILNR